MLTEAEDRKLQELKAKSFPIKSRIAHRRKEASCHRRQGGDMEPSEERPG